MKASTSEIAPTIAIVGAGPAGCYTAQVLRRKLPNAQIVIFDRLPVPYGLLRYGVAADHQGTKAVCAQFERMFLKSDVEFRGGVEVGAPTSAAEVTLGKLQEAFDVVILATGLAADGLLGIPGEDRPGAIGSGRLTRALNSHPDEFGTRIVVGKHVAVIGAGNIAVDIVRVLLRSPAEWAGSDMDPEVLGQIVPEPVESIEIVVRASADGARWDAAMIGELAKLSRPNFQMALPIDLPSDSPGVAALRDLANAQRRGPTRVTFHFETKVESILGSGTSGEVQGIAIDATSGHGTIAVDTVISAIGFQQAPSTLPERVYATGWLATGPQGTIPQQRTLAQHLVTRILADLESAPPWTPRHGLEMLNLPNTIDFNGWRRIDAAEQAGAQPDRVRRKFSSHEMLLDASRSAIDVDAARSVSGAHSRLGTPLTEESTVI